MTEPAPKVRIIRRNVPPSPPPDPDATAVVVNTGLPTAQLPAVQPKTVLAIPQFTGPRLRTFIDADFVEQVFETLGWSVAEELELYKEIASDEDVPPKIRMAAARAIHDIAVKTLLLRGDIAEATLTSRRTRDDGTVDVAKMQGIVSKTREKTGAFYGPSLNLPSVTTKEPQHDAESERESAGGSGSAASGAYHAAPTAESGTDGRGRGTPAALSVPTGPRGANPITVTVLPCPDSSPSAPSPGGETGQGDENTGGGHSGGSEEGEGAPGDEGSNPQGTT